MAQITGGIRSVLSHPIVYDTLQNFLGAKKFRAFFSESMIRSRYSDRILDLGCGTAEILDFMPEVEYIGYDISSQYIEAAKRRFGPRGNFEARIATEDEVSRGVPFDIVLALGVLHHLDDETAVTLMRTAHAALKPGGRLVTLDPVFEGGQSPLARFLISKDRGQNVRDQAGYENLARHSFQNVRTTVRHQSWIPYTHCFIEAVK